MDETLDRLGASIKAGLSASVTGHAVANGELTMFAKAADIVKVATFLRDDRGLPVHLHHRHHRDRLAGPRAALRRRLSFPVAAAEPAHPSQGDDRRDDAGALDHRRVPRRRLVRARDLRSLRRVVLGPSRHAPHPHRLRFRRPSAAQGFPADRLRRGALRRRAEARRLRQGAAGAGIPHFRFPLALGRHRLRHSGRREGRQGRATS